MRRRDAGGAITEYLVLLVGILAGLMLLSANIGPRSGQLMNTAIQQIPIVP
ncbi:MAG: hypothetical protein Q8R78_02470 [Candidatus Omnitrophota bacterium]|nr:hypothetical protein [Candidatus Omnitrophota bacterium]